MRTFVEIGILSCILILCSCKHHISVPSKVNINSCFSRYQFINDSHGSELNTIALSYFGLESSDTIIRIWVRDYTSLDTGGLYSIHLFEYGNYSKVFSHESNLKIVNKVNTPYASYNIFEIDGRTDSFPSWRVKKVNTQFLNPKSGWKKFMEKVAYDSLDKIYLLPKSSNYLNHCYECNLSIEFIFSGKVFAVDFTGNNEIDKSKFPGDIAFLKLVYLIDGEFGIRLGNFQLPWPNRRKDE